MVTYPYSDFNVCGLTIFKNIRYLQCHFLKHSFKLFTAQCVPEIHPKRIIRTNRSPCTLLNQRFQVFPEENWFCKMSFPDIWWKVVSWWTIPVQTKLNYFQQNFPEPFPKCQFLRKERRHNVFQNYFITFFPFYICLMGLLFNEPDMENHTVSR